MSAALGPGLAENPLPRQWLEFTEDERVLLKLGKVEIGQGIVTALTQIASDELDLDWGRVRPVPTSTSGSPDEGITAGSRSVMISGRAVRMVCAQVRALLLDAAADRRGVARESLRVVDGSVLGPDGARLGSYWELLTAELLATPVTGLVAPKSPAQHQLVGRALPRLDLADKFTGRPRYVQDLELPGMRYGRMVRPPAPGAQLLEVDEGPARKYGSVRAVLRRGSLLGVVAEREEDAVRAAEKLRAQCLWDTSASLPDMARLPEFLRDSPVEDVPIATAATRVARQRVHQTLTRHYRKPYVAHASIAPGCAVARWADGRLEVWTHSQGIYPLRAALAGACGLATEAVVVHHAEGAGCYGHNSADDVAFDAALLALEVPGEPVQVLWSRDDEFRWEPYGPAALCEVSAGLDEAGDIVRWHQRTFSGGHNGRPGYAGGPGLLGAAHAAGAQPLAATDYPLAAGGGIGRNGIPAYRIEELEVTASRVLTMPLRTSSLRGLGATVNVFAIESAMDELAELAGADPIQYRRRHLTDERAIAVLDTVARMADWERRAEHSGGRDSVGWGVAYSRYKDICGYCAVVAEVEAVSAVRVRRLFVAVDAGQVINPDGLRNQVEGGAVQATSWTLLEEVHFDQKAVTSSDWESYPILRFSDVPEVEIEVINRPDQPPLGVGEIAGGPVTSAIANAVADALGIRIRTLPLTPENIVAAIDQA